MSTRSKLLVVLLLAGLLLGGQAWQSPFAFAKTGAPRLRQAMTDPRYSRPFGGAYWQVSEGGRQVLGSRSLWDTELALVDARKYGETAFEIPGPDDSALYVVGREVTLGEGRRFQLLVAIDHAEVDAARHAFAWDVARVLVPIALILALGAWLQLRFSLSPLRELDVELRDVHDGRAARLSATFPTEIAPLAADLNRLLDRQEQLVRRARDRAGSLAHGLKTPLTIIGAEARNLEREGMVSSAARIDHQLDLVRRYVDRELARARTAGAPAAGGAFTAAAETVDRLFRLMRRMPRGDAIEWRNDLPAGLALGVDPDDFGEVVGNLLDNARKWARRQVVVSAMASGDRVDLVIADDGPGFPGETGRTIPERGISSGPAAESSGLGLTIVRDILAEYGVAPEVGRRDGWCRVSFVMPASPVRPAARKADDPRIAIRPASSGSVVTG